MTASNLSICVGPSILWSSDQAYIMDQNYSKEVPTFQKKKQKHNSVILQVSALVQILIEDFAKIFGPDTPDLFVQQVVTKAMVLGRAGIGLS